MRAAPALPTAAAGLEEHHRLGMAELGYRGLSEQWLMRRAGDLHWRLIAAAMGQAQAVFTCAAGQPLYAAFCVSRLVLAAPAAPRPGGLLTLSARLHGIGASRLGSWQRLSLDGVEIGRLALVSVFVGHDETGRNARVVRRAPRALVQPPPAPAPLARLAARAAAARGMAARPATGSALVPGPALLPCPATEFNAAGLLYFPSFAALIERADFTRGAPAGRWLAARTVLYLGNADPGECLGTGFAPARGGHLARVTGPDGRLLALARSRYLAAPIP